MATYMATSINDSPVISGVAAEDIADVRGLVVGFNSEGKIEIAKDATKIIGVGIMTNGDEGAVKKGGRVDIQIKDIGMVRTSAAVAAGDPLGVELTTGKVKPFESGTCIGYALKSASGADKMIPVQIAKTTEAAGE